MGVQSVGEMVCPPTVFKSSKQLAIPVSYTMLVCMMIFVRPGKRVLELYPFFVILIYTCILISYNKVGIGGILVKHH